MGLPLLSGKVGVVSFAGLSTSRIQIVGGEKTFLSLGEWASLLFSALLFFLALF